MQLQMAGYISLFRMSGFVEVSLRHFTHIILIMYKLFVERNVTCEPWNGNSVGVVFKVATSYNAALFGCV